MRKANLIGINHIALEVGDVEKAFDFLDPWGNFIQVVEYSSIQFTKAPEVLAGMKLEVHKNETALQELAEKGMGAK